MHLVVVVQPNYIINNGAGAGEGHPGAGAGEGHPWTQQHLMRMRILSSVHGR